MNLIVTILLLSCSLNWTVQIQKLKSLRFIFVRRWYSALMVSFLPAFWAPFLSPCSYLCFALLHSDPADRPKIFFLANFLCYLYFSTIANSTWLSVSFYRWHFRLLYSRENRSSFFHLCCFELLCFSFIKRVEVFRFHVWFLSGFELLI